MQIVSAALGDDIELSAASNAEFGAVVATDGAELAHGFDVGRQRRPPVSTCVDVVAAVQQPGVMRGPDAVDRGVVVAAVAGRGRDRSRHRQGEGKNVPPLGRHFKHLPPLQHGAGGPGGRVHRDQFRFHVHLLGHRPDFDSEVDAPIVVDPQHHPRNAVGAEAGRFGGHVIGADRHQSQDKVARIVRVRLHRAPGFEIAQRDGRAWNRRRRSVQNRSVDAGCHLLSEGSAAKYQNPQQQRVVAHAKVPFPEKDIPDLE